MGGDIGRHLPRSHPGNSKKKARSTPKGRQAAQTDLEAISNLIGNDSLSRDLLIENLHLIQDRYHQISVKHLAALAELMGIPLAEAYEVASFYAHFDVVSDNDKPIPELTIRVCDSLTCELFGANPLFEELENRFSESIRIVKVPCMGMCDRAPVAEVGHNHVPNATLSSICKVIANKEVQSNKPDFISFDNYRKTGGYLLLESCVRGEISRDSVIMQLSDSGIRGLGGAGFPTGKKWSIVKSYPGPRVMAVNGDEGEPGTFKDRLYLERDPHRFLEGMLIGAWVVEATDVYIYLRDEYPGIYSALVDEIAVLSASGVLGDTNVHLRRGAGAYICGEESAMIESIEGKRGLPRHRPPFVAEVGLFGKPTLVNNIETLFWVRDIVEKGAGWFLAQGGEKGKGLRSYSLSGRIKKPGVKLAPAGSTAWDLVMNYGGGMLDGHKFKAYLPGGASGGILPASKADLPLDFGTLNAEGCFVGSHAVVILSDQDDMKDVARNLMRFFKSESCGQCTPCRVGTEKALDLMSPSKWNEPVLREVAQCMSDASICGLGQAASNPLICVLKNFSEEVS